MRGMERNTLGWSGAEYPRMVWSGILWDGLERNTPGWSGAEYSEMVWSGIPGDGLERSSREWWSRILAAGVEKFKGMDWSSIVG